MANKRIKISELPKITFNPVAGGTDTTLTDSDYLPIAVTDRNNAAIKTTMAVTTRELQRFILQQPRELEDATNELTIGRPGLTVKTPTLSGTTLTIAGSAIINYASVDSINMAKVITPNGIQCGPSTYPTVLRDSQNNLVSFGLLVSSPNGVITGEGWTLRKLLQSTPITSGAQHAGKLLSVGLDGRMNFNYDSANLFNEAGSLTSNPDYYGNVLSISNNGAVDTNTNLSITNVRNTVSTVSKILPMTSATNNSSEKFITTNLSGSGGNTIGDVQMHNSGELEDSLNVRTVVEAIKSLKTRIGDATGSNQQIVVSNANTPTLTSLRMARADHLKLTTVNSIGNDAADWNDNAANKGLNRVVMASPVVLGAKHADNIDLTDVTTEQGPNGPKNFPAQIGEIRWNIYNNVPTIYLAVAELPTEDGGVIGAKTWYGVPLFGTIAESGSTLTATSVTAHSYEDLD